MADLDEAVRLLQEGDWEAAHRIAQESSSTLAWWAHGIVHLMEGDRDNARYWYGRAGRELSRGVDLADEIEQLQRAVHGAQHKE